MPCRIGDAIAKTQRLCALFAVRSRGSLVLAEPRMKRLDERIVARDVAERRERDHELRAFSLERNATARALDLSAARREHRAAGGDLVAPLLRVVERVALLRVGLGQALLLFDRLLRFVE